jgi:hypothetical protein
MNRNFCEADSWGETRQISQFESSHVHGISASFGVLEFVFGYLVMFEQVRCWWRRMSLLRDRGSRRWLLPTLRVGSFPVELITPRIKPFALLPHLIIRFLILNQEAPTLWIQTKPPTHASTSETSHSHQISSPTLHRRSSNP